MTGDCSSQQASVQGDKAVRGRFRDEHPWMDFQAGIDDLLTPTVKGELFGLIRGGREQATAVNETQQEGLPRLVKQRERFSLMKIFQPQPRTRAGEVGT